MIYVDPSAGSIFLQIAFAAVVGGALVAKRWWARWWGPFEACSAAFDPTETT